MRDAELAVRRGPSASPTHPDPAPPSTVEVWDWPLRVWHWSLAVLVLIACVTPNSYDGLHRFAGYAVIGLLTFRLIWGFLGTRHARFDKVALKLRAAPGYLWNLRHGATGRYLGLNPAGAALLVAMLALLAISAVSGAMQVTVRFFGVWWVEDTHAYASNAIIGLAGLHVLGTLVMSVLQRENLVRAMFTGRKRAPGNAASSHGHPSTADSAPRPQPVKPIRAEQRAADSRRHFGNPGPWIENGGRN